MKKDKKDCKIELAYQGFTTIDSLRYYWYRIVPSELPFFQRIFGNPWRVIYRFCDFSGADFISEAFTVDDYYEHISPLKTYGDVVSFLARQAELAEYRRAQMIAAKKIWPD